MIFPRPLAETIPAVTVWLKLAEKGLPTAITHSPTLNASESPNSRSVRPRASICSTARSDLGSRPIIDASYSVLSNSRTVISSISSTTWLFVMIYPFLESTITPEPRAVDLNSRCGCWKKNRNKSLSWGEFR